MAHAKHSKGRGTTLDRQGSEPLARAVYAVDGTRSADVLLEMESIIGALGMDEPLPERLRIPLRIVLDLHEIAGGLVLCDGMVRGRKTTFSTRYEHRPEKEHYILTIGSALPERRLRTAAYEIIALLKRGICTWTIADPLGRVRACRNAYGPAAAKSIDYDAPSRSRRYVEHRYRPHSSRVSFGTL